MQTPSDQALIAGCIAGRKESWDIFVERFSRLVYWAIRKTLSASAFKNRSDLSQDIFQEFFVKFIEKNELERLRNADSLRKFLTVSACHLTMDKLKSLSRYDKKTVQEIIFDGGSNPSDPLQKVESGVLDPGSHAVSKEQQGVIFEVLENLSSKEHLCVEWHYLEGKTHKEIAGILGLPQDTVSTVIRRTKEKLKKAFEEKGLFE